ncbi:MAG: outer membrane lipoprotein carrier protein LolA [Paludibacterium sp.]|uniref:LolA-related protein n=1 Tax=Paludibacterium sp. TaxID=1917523 RepID=UPI0026007B2F|nr:LolA-related protein [Paludibacterium sp.]MBV8045744.1 outer membrane lipoprotein carrier protein LolA [Paludibacterium sp.]MBV8649751.1 outer membrane lipoprotein carrier protein LolA [Paludibacterium sp.]
MYAHRVAKPLAGLLFLLAVTAAHAASFGMPDLMQMLSQQPSGKATFVEKKTLAVLKEPLESSGELSFTAPDRLEKRTLKPKPEAIVLVGDRLTLERSDGRKMTVSLSDRPEAAAFVESIRATLSGDRGALERYYAIALDGTAGNWQLTLTPLQARMQKIISQIRISGARAQVKTISFLQADGDRSDMTITSTAAR